MSTPLSIALLMPEAAEWRTMLHGRLPAGCQWVASAAEAEVLVGRPVDIAAVLPHCRRLRWAQSTFAGVDALMRPGLRRDYQLSRVTGLFGPAMAEWAFAHIVSRERGFAALAEQQSQKIWRQRPYRLLSELHVGLAGLGEIGACLAATARHFGMRVSGYSLSGAACPGVDRVWAHAEGGATFRSFVADLDYVLCTLPDTALTRGLVDGESLAAMKPGAVLINAGRGSLVDERALAASLRSGHLGGAVLDVFAEEPLPPESPLWTIPGCTISPHCSALSFPRQVGALFLENLKRFQAGDMLRGSVDFSKGY